MEYEARSVAVVMWAASGVVRSITARSEDDTALGSDSPGAEFTPTQGEANGSLRYWQAAHWAYFGRECERIGRIADAKMPVVCERFDVVFRR